ncbi:MAG: YkgJ family cysteine cluster protein [Flavobacteriales bacterium]
MDDVIQKLPQKAKDKQKEHKLFLEKLKKKKPKKLDFMMQEIHHEIFQKIDCLECANCCKTTGPLLIQKDIERIAKHLRIKPQQFVNQYLRLDEDQDYVFQSMPCPFLGSDHYCSIYEVRPKACKEFPHTNRKKFYQINALTLENVKICPAVYEIMEEIQKKLRV